MKKLFFVLLVIIVAGIGYVIWTWDGSAPALTWNPPKALGKKGQVLLQVEDKGRGLRSVQVSVRQGSVERLVVNQEFPALAWPWQKGESKHTVTISAEQLLGQPPLKQGALQVEVKAADQANLFISQRTSVDSKTVQFDTRPPQLAVLSQQHYIRQGGSEAVLYRVSKDAKESGVQVGSTRFLGFPVPSGQPDTYICLFALSWDQPVDTPMALWAVDEAGNRAQMNFWKKVFPAAFRKRDMPIDDNFMQAVVPEILAHTEQVTEKSTLLESYLEINRKLRQANNDEISRLGHESAPRPLWSKPFLQLTNSQVEAVFADQRTYFYEGKEIDRQTHLGFDLATSAQNPVEASNDGLVVYADYLGIYGNCIIIDHGLGLQSLYGHLSSIDVKKGDKVRLGQTLGRTGQTGLAGGDHLHFSMVLQGVQVNPVEWWDPHWLQDRVLPKLAGQTQPEISGKPAS